MGVRTKQTFETNLYQCGWTNKAGKTKTFRNFKQTKGFIAEN